MAKLVIGTDINNTGTSSIIKEKPVPMPYSITWINNDGTLLPPSDPVFDMTNINSIGSKCFYYTFYSNSYVTEVNWNNIEIISGDYACYYTFSKCNNITSIDLSSLTEISGEYACYGTFQNCTGITGTLDLSSLNKVAGYYTTSYMFYGCTGITKVILGPLSDLRGSYTCERMFSGCSNLETVDFSRLPKKLKNDGNNGSTFSYAFQNCTKLKKVDLSNIEVAGGAHMFPNTFNGCTGITDIDLSNLAISFAGQTFFSSTFTACTSLTTVKFDSLTRYTAATPFYKTFVSCTGLKTVYYPALRNNVFWNQGILSSDCVGVELHFPKNMQSTMSNWQVVQTGFGGTDSVILWDLPSVFILTGTNTQEYERNPKYDTATALAWRKKDTGTNFNTYTIDWTSYYTSSLNDPQVGDTIYSDPECAQAVTTIDSIA